MITILFMIIPNIKKQYFDSIFCIKPDHFINDIDKHNKPGRVKRFIKPTDHFIIDIDKHNKPKHIKHFINDIDKHNKPKHIKNFIKPIQQKDNVYYTKNIHKILHFNTKLLRNLIRKDIIRFRKRNIKKCLFCGSRKNLEVDHFNPTFAEIKNQFFKILSIYLQINKKLRVSLIKKIWIEFHRKYANLRFLCKSCHLTV